MDRKTFWYGELISASGNFSLNDPSTFAENADHNLYSDNLPAGICLGLSVTQQSSPNMTVQVAQGVAYDASGERINVPNAQVVNVAVDSSGAPTTVTGGGNSKIVSVLVQFERNNQSAFVDLNSNPGFNYSYESFQCVVVQGAEGATPSPPAIPSGMVLLADITIAYGQTNVVNANIDLGTRRAFAWRIVGTGHASPHTILEGQPAAAMADLLGWFNGHVSGVTDQHNATALQYSGSGATKWANATSLAAGTVDATLTAIVSTLAGEITSSSGADHIGCPVINSASLSIFAGTLASQLAALQSAANIQMSASPALLDTTTIAPAGLASWLGSLVSKLSEQNPAGSSVDGASIIGAHGAAGGFFTVNGSVRSQLDALGSQFYTAATFSGTVQLAKVPTFSGTPVTLTRHLALRIANVKNAATGFTTATQASAVLTDSNAILAQDAGQIIVSRLDQATGDFFDIPLDDVPDGATFSGVVVSTIGLVRAPTVYPTYQLFKTDGETNNAVLCGAVADAHTSGNWTSSVVDTTVNVTTGGSSVTINKSAYTYFLRVFCPYENSFGGCQVAVCRVKATWIPTQVCV